MGSRRRAFTLIELLAVLANAAIIAGILVPAALSLRESLLR